MLRSSYLTRVAAALVLALATTACGEPTTNRPPAALIACPAATSVSSSALLGVAGGTVSAGGSSIRVPAGALTEPTQISLTVPASPNMQIDVQAGGAEHFTFNLPVVITIDYSRCENITRRISVWNIDDLTRTLLERLPAIDDRPNRRVTFLTGHLSSYAIAY